MDNIVTSVVPLFSIIFIGFFAGKLKMMDQYAVRTLVGFVFNIAMPALIFRMMAKTDIAAIDDWLVLAAYFAAQAPIFLLGMIIGRLLFRQTLAESTIQGFGSSFSNGVILGLPLALSLYGDRGGVPALLIIMLDILLFSAVTLLLEFATLEDRGKRTDRPLTIIRNLLFSVIRNPLILASVLGLGFGLGFGLLGVSLPSVIDKTLAFTGQAGPPAGLFALGATLGLRKIGGKLRPVAAMVLIKLVLHPIVAWLTATHLFGLDPLMMSVVLIFAACPVGANVYVFAQQYEAGIETSASAVLISTALALLTISLLIIMLNST